MEDLPEELFTEIIARISRTSDLNSLSLVSKRLYTIEAGQRRALCKGINEYDLLKFGPGWMKLLKFGFDTKKRVVNIPGGYDFHDDLYDAHNPSRYDFFCAMLKDLSLARFTTGTEVGLRVLLGKCKALERLCLEYVFGLNDNDITALSQSCRNLKSISLWLKPLHYDDDYRTGFTDNSLKALSLGCPMLQAIELTFVGCQPGWPSDISFTQEGLLVLIQSCPIRVLVLNDANFFDDHGMKALSSAPFLERIELTDSEKITDAGMRFIACNPCLTSLTLRRCDNVTDFGLAELARSQKLESLIIECCRSISLQAAQGAAKSVNYSKSSQVGIVERMYF